MLKFSFKDASRTLIFLVSIVAALWGPLMSIWNNLTIWKDDPASWGSMFQTHFVTVSSVIYLCITSLKARDMIPHWLIGMNTDDVSTMVNNIKAANLAEAAGQNIQGLAQGKAQKIEDLARDTAQAEQAQTEAVKVPPSNSTKETK